MTTARPMESVKRLISSTPSRDQTHTCCSLQPLSQSLPHLRSNCADNWDIYQVVAPAPSAPPSAPLTDDAPLLPPPPSPPPPPAPHPPTVCPPGLLPCEMGCLRAISSSACPSDANLLSCNLAAIGGLCEADGECGTDRRLDNCDPGGWDVYEILPSLLLPRPPNPPPPPSPTPPPSPPPSPTPSPPPSPSPLLPGASYTLAVVFTATVEGDLLFFDAVAYQSQLAALLNINTSAVVSLVTHGGSAERRRRALQAASSGSAASDGNSNATGVVTDADGDPSFRVVAAVAAPSDSEAAVLAAQLAEYSAVELAAALSVPVVSVAPPTISDVVTYAIAPPPPPDDLAGNSIAAQAAGGARSASVASAAVAVVAVIVVLSIAAFAFIYWRTAPKPKADGSTTALAGAVADEEMPEVADDGHLMGTSASATITSTSDYTTNYLTSGGPRPDDEEFI